MTGWILSRVRKGKRVVFTTTAIDHSAIPPRLKSVKKL
jgi:hypothetical protein